MIQVAASSRAGDTRGPARPSNGASTNARPPKNMAIRPDPEREADRRRERDRVAERRSPNALELKVSATAMISHRQPEQGQVRGELLEADASLAERRRGDEVEAAAGGLAGERAGQRQDRPDGRAEGEDGSRT